MSEFYIVADCPICPGSGELFALLSEPKKRLLFYCPSCETAWNKIPEQVDEIRTLDFFAPEGVIRASIKDLDENGIIKYKCTNVYESLDELLDK